MKTQIYVKTKCNGKHFIIPVLEAETGGSLGLAGQQSAVLMNPRPVKHSNKLVFLRMASGCPLHMCIHTYMCTWIFYKRRNF